MRTKKGLVAGLAVLATLALASCQEHVHTFSSEWTFDETSHWHSATCEHKDQVSEKAEHTWDSGKVTVEPTEEKEGKKVYTCTVCDATKEEAIAKLEHTHKFEAGWQSDDTHHWHNSTCGHDVIDGKAEHTWDAGTVTKEPSAFEAGEKKYTCTVCGKEKTVALDIVRNYEHKDWDVLNNKEGYFFVGDDVYVANKEDIKADGDHFIYANNNFILNKASLGENLTVSVDIKGNTNKDVTCEMDAGIVVWYVDANNYLVAGVKWADWDRPQEIRSLFVNGLVDGKQVAMDFWTDNSGLTPADGLNLSITKRNSKYAYTIKSDFFNKTGDFTVKGTESEGRIGLYGANHEFKLSNFSFKKEEAITKTTYNQVVGEVTNTLTIDTKDNSFVLVENGVTSKGTYTANGRNLTLTFEDASVRYVKAFDNNLTFEFYTPAKPEENAIIVDGTAGKAVHNLKTGYTGDYTLNFKYLGERLEAGAASKLGVNLWYIDADNYLELYVEWSASDRPHEIRCVQITGKIGGAEVGWNDFWCDGSNVLPGDGGELLITKTGKVFTFKLTAGSFVKEDSKEFNFDTALAYNVDLYAEGDKVSFSNASIYQDITDKFDATGENLVLRDDKLVLSSNSKVMTKKTFTGDFSLDMSVLGTLAEAGTASKIGFYPWYVDENNYITIYVEWSASDRPHEIRCVQLTGKVNGVDLGWNDFWCDGSNVLPADGFKLNITKTGNEISFKLTSGEFVKEGSKVIDGMNLESAYKQGFYTENDSFVLTK